MKRDNTRRPKPGKSRSPVARPGRNPQTKPEGKTGQRELQRQAVAGGHKKPDSRTKPAADSAEARSNRGEPPRRTGHSAKRSGRPVADDILYLYGQHTVRAALANPQRKKHKIHATENALSRLQDALPTDGTPEIFLTDTAGLNALVGTEAVHQGVVLECAPLATLDSSELFHLADARLLLALDQITDPHNVGAILRSAVAMGVEAVLMTSRNSAVETAVLAKSASGALDMVPVIELRNLSKSLEELNAMRIVTVGLDSEGPLVLEETLNAHAGQSVCLVLGSEGTGLRQKTRETCTALARLDVPGPIKSLNVSNAAALSLYLAQSALNRKA